MVLVSPMDSSLPELGEIPLPGTDCWPYLRGWLPQPHPEEGRSPSQELVAVPLGASSLEPPPI